MTRRSGWPAASAGVTAYRSRVTPRSFVRLPGWPASSLAAFPDRRPRSTKSISVRAHHFPAVSRGEGLIDAELTAGVDGPDDRAGVEGRSIGNLILVLISLPGDERPAIDRVLDEPNRAVAKGEIEPARVKAGRITRDNNS